MHYYFLGVGGWCFFFFQAEDGIRDAQESRGLGDVYKRQGVTLGKAVGTGVLGRLGSGVSLGRGNVAVICMPWLADVTCCARLTSVATIAVSLSLIHI